MTTETAVKIDAKQVKELRDKSGAPMGDCLKALQEANGETRDVALRPTSYPGVQALLYDQWLRHNRQAVADASRGKLGYLHISQMAMPNFRKFEEELVSEGVGKDGLIIDVRENPGGSTADHLLTALTQPVHAIAVPRGGGPGYPHDRKVYVTVVAYKRHPRMYVITRFSATLRRADLDCIFQSSRWI